MTFGAIALARRRQPSKLERQSSPLCSMGRDDNLSGFDTLGV
jgi:hypothetical protein